MVQTVRFQTLYVLFFISHGRRQLMHFEVTAHPTAAWVWRRLIEATPWERQPTHLIHDRDRAWGADFESKASAIGIKSLQTPIRAPNANAIGSGWWAPYVASASTICSSSARAIFARCWPSSSPTTTRNAHTELSG